MPLWLFGTSVRSALPQFNHGATSLAVRHFHCLYVVKLFVVKHVTMQFSKFILVTCVVDECLRILLLSFIATTPQLAMPRHYGCHVCILAAYAYRLRVAKVRQGRTKCNS